MLIYQFYLTSKFLVFALYISNFVHCVPFYNWCFLFVGFSVYHKIFLFISNMYIFASYFILWFALELLTDFFCLVFAQCIFCISLFSTSWPYFCVVNWVACSLMILWKSNLNIFIFAQVIHLHLFIYLDELVLCGLTSWFTMFYLWIYFSFLSNVRLEYCTIHFLSFCWFGSYRLSIILMLSLKIHHVHSTTKLSKQYSYSVLLFPPEYSKNLAYINYLLISLPIFWLLS